jgi:predicted thioesterase
VDHANARHRAAAAIGADGATVMARCRQRRGRRSDVQQKLVQDARRVLLAHVLHQQLFLDRFRTNVL